MSRQLGAQNRRHNSRNVPYCRVRQIQPAEIRDYLSIKNLIIPLNRVDQPRNVERRSDAIEERRRNATEQQTQVALEERINEEIIEERRNDMPQEIRRNNNIPVQVGAQRNELPNRRRHAVIPHRVTYKYALRYGHLSVQEIQPFHLGDFRPRCQFCGAKYFQKESSNRQGNYIQCCHLGQVELPQLSDCPEELRRLLTENDRDANQYREHIRSVNSNFAMASFKATYPNDRNVGQGAWCFTITGQIYHHVEPIPDLNGNDPIKLNQLYFIDTEQACDKRHQFLGERVNPETLLLIERMLRANNPLCQSFMAMSEIVNEHEMNNASIVFKENIRTEVNRYNLPSGRSEIAAVFDGDHPPFNVDLIVYPRNSGMISQLKNLNCYADPMVYPLLFPNGDFGYKTNVHHVRGNLNRTVTFRQFYAYRIAIRDGFSILHNSGKLYQQYLVDSYCKVESNDMWYIKDHQKTLRVDSYTEIRRLLTERANEVNGRVGKLIILPSSRVGSPRYMQKMYSDAMAILARHGKPDLFITFTTNPKWSEISDNLEFKQKYEHRPDLVCRVFRAKFTDFLKQLTEKQVLGVVQNYSYVVEFQKRGLPHAHLLITLRPEDKFDVDTVNDYVCAEIPDQEQDPALYDIVVEHYMHKPCGATNPEAPCMRDGKCSKAFPKSFSDETIINDVPRAVYRRRRDGRSVQIDGQVLDNRRVVPYNRYLAKKYECHINFEVCTSMGSMKYLYKYVHKGHDCITMKVSEDGQNVVDWDEVERYLDCRYISSSEASYRLMQYPLQDRSHSVLTLPVHLEGEHVIVYDEDQPDEQINQNIEKPSKLMAWFNLNLTDRDARNLHYVQIPEHYTWDNKEAVWRQRKQVSKMIGKLMEVSPDKVELIHLRILLGHKPGVTSFQQLRTVEGVVYDSYYDTCKAMNLVEDLHEYEECLAEMARERFPPRLRRVFALICCIATEEQVPQIPAMWERFNSVLSEDFVRRGMCEQRALNHCLKSIDFHLKRNGKTLADFNLPLPYDEEYDDVPEPPIQPVPVETLNNEQTIIYNEVMNAVECSTTGGLPNTNMFFIDGPAGTGKTYLYNAIITNIRASGKHTIAVAWTGIASTLLVYGTTVHRAFRLPLELHDDTVAGWTIEAMQSRVVKSAAVIIWDEAPMSPKLALEAIDRYLRDLMERPNVPMGGKVVIFGGDFRQVLPVVRRGSRAQVINASFKSSVLWPGMKNFKLKRNMRTEADEIEFANWLLKVGNGQLPEMKIDGNLLPDTIEIPHEILVDSTEKLIDKVFGSTLQEDPSDKAILCPTNKSAKDVNEMIMDRIDDEVRIYLSSDKYNAEPEDEFVPTIEVLNAIESSSLSPHVLKLKKGVVVMLLRNIDLEDGLCNGTRLKVLKMYNHAIDVEILTGKKKGETALIPRMRISTKEEVLPRPMTRFQFPLKMSFAMTINKSQGQTFGKIGIRLTTPCFAHGQLYVAFSRVRRLNDVHMYMENTIMQGSVEVDGMKKHFTKNIVYKSLITPNMLNYGEMDADDLEINGQGYNENINTQDENVVVEENMDIEVLNENDSEILNVQPDNFGRLEEMEVDDDYLNEVMNHFDNFYRQAEVFADISPRDRINSSNRVSVYDKPGTSGILGTFIRAMDTDTDDDDNDEDNVIEEQARNEE